MLCIQGPVIRAFLFPVQHNVLVIKIMLSIDRNKAMRNTPYLHCAALNYYTAFYDTTNKLFKKKISALERCHFFLCYSIKNFFRQKKNRK